MMRLIFFKLIISPSLHQMALGECGRAFTAFTFFLPNDDKKEDEKKKKDELPFSQSTISSTDLG
jgi:hypothetical protein